MKKIIVLIVFALLTTACKGQEKNKIADHRKEQIEKITEQPKGTWKVDKEFDEHGNLIRYDSIYSWSSIDNYGGWPQTHPDSILQSFRSKFNRSFKEWEGFGNLFVEDSLFTNQFFNEGFFESEFGKDFMDLDRVRERMETLQRQFMKRYGAQLDSIQNIESQTGDKHSKTFLGI